MSLSNRSPIQDNPETWGTIRLVWDTQSLLLREPKQVGIHVLSTLGQKRVYCQIALAMAGTWRKCCHLCSLNLKPSRGLLLGRVRKVCSVAM